MQHPRAATIENLAFDHLQLSLFVPLPLPAAPGSAPDTRVVRITVLMLILVLEYEMFDSG